jgi:hypothetical protein
MAHHLAAIAGFAAPVISPARTAARRAGRSAEAFLLFLVVLYIAAGLLGGAIYGLIGGGGPAKTGIARGARRA